MKTNIEEVRAQINEARARLANAEAELAKMEAKPARWEPKGGAWYLDGASTLLGGGPSMTGARLSGAEYPTREAAESALPYVTFYKRLCCLAQELNPSGKVGGEFYVRAAGNNNCWSATECVYRTEQCLFETHTAAERAAEIMNRDGWKLP